MNRSPSVFPSVLSFTLIASLSMLNMGSAWSAEQTEESGKASKAKSTQSKVVKAKSSKYKSARAKAKKPSLAKKAAPLKLQASKELPASFAAVSDKVTTNPYFANQPIAILPLAAQTAPLAAAAAVPASTPAAIAAPSQAAQAASQAEPVAAAATSSTVSASLSTTAPAPQSNATEASASFPSLNPPIYDQVATAPAVNSRIAAQALNPPVATYKNPYLTNQAQPFVLPDLFKLFSLFGSGLKIASPFPQQAYTTPSAPAAPAYNAPAYNAPAYTPPAYTPPAFSAPAFSLPAFKAPAYNAASYGSAGYGSPSPAQVAPVGQSAPVVQTAPVAQSATASASNSVSSLFSSLKMMIPLTGDSNILPSIKKVYPTGEKPLVVLNFKCPTEVIGITPPPMKLLHEAVNLGFDGLNKTNLLSFNLQQVCS